MLHTGNYDIFKMTIFIALITMILKKYLISNDYTYSKTFVKGKTRLWFWRPCLGPILADLYAVLHVFLYRCISASCLSGCYHVSGEQTLGRSE